MSHHHSTTNPRSGDGPRKISVNFDWFNPKKKSKDDSNENERLQKIEEMVMLSK
jgi:hypothetical protein